MHEEAINVIDRQIRLVLDPNRRQAIALRNHTESARLAGEIEHLEQSKLVLIIDSENRKNRA